MDNLIAVGRFPPAIGLSAAGLGPVPLWLGDWWVDPALLAVFGAGALGLHVRNVRHKRLAMPPTKGIVFGDLGKRPVAQSRRDREMHEAVYGGTGTGKTTELVNQVLQDVAEGNSVVVVDPITGEGAVVDEVLARIPEKALPNVCLVDPLDPHAAVGINPLAGVDPDLAAERIVSLEQRLVGAWGPKLEDGLRHMIATIGRVPGLTLVDAPRLLLDDDFREQAVAAAFPEPEPTIAARPHLRFWRKWADGTDAERRDLTETLGYKLEHVLNRLAFILGQPHPKQDPFAELNRRQVVLLVRAPIGLIGEQPARALGSIVVEMLWAAMQARAAIPLRQRRPVSLYLDELPKFVGLQILDKMYAEARKFRLAIIAALQALFQLKGDMAASLAANARTKLVFACAPADASVLAKHFGHPRTEAEREAGAPERPHITAEQLADLPPYHCAARIMVRGGLSDPMVLKTRDLPPEIPGRRRGAIDHSRELWARPIAEVEAELLNGSSNEPGNGAGNGVGNGTPRPLPLPLPAPQGVLAEASDRTEAEPREGSELEWPGGASASERDGGQEPSEAGPEGAGLRVLARTLTPLDCDILIWLRDAPDAQPSTTERIAEALGSRRRDVNARLLVLIDRMEREGRVAYGHGLVRRQRWEGKLGARSPWDWRLTEKGKTFVAWQAAEVPR